MKQQHFDEFCELLDTIAEQYSKTMTPSLKMLYWQGLYDFEFEAVKQALFRHIRNTDKDGDFMPKISNIKKMIEGSTQDSAIVAWAKVDRALRQIGTYESVVFDDSLIHRVLYDMGGWIPLGSKSNDEWPFVAKEFENRYRGYKSRSEKPEYPSRLIGISESHNSKEGFEIDKPILIGEKNKCLYIMNHGMDQIEFKKQRMGFIKLDSDVKKAVGVINSLSTEEGAA